MKRREFPDILEDLQKAMKSLAAYSEELERQFLGRRAAGLIDRFHVSIKRGVKVKSLRYGAMVEAQTELLERQRKMRAEMSRDPLVDFAIKLTLWYSKKTGSYVGVVTSDHYEAYKLFMRTGVAEDFTYWSNTDRPDHLNARQWKKRGDIWHEVSRSDALPAITMDVPEPGFVSNSEAASYVPSFEKRVTSVAVDIAIREWWKATNAESQAKISVAQWGAFMADVFEPGTEAASYLEAARTEVEGILLREITKETLGERLIAPPELEKDEEAKAAV